MQIINRDTKKNEKVVFFYVVLSLTWCVTVELKSVNSLNRSKTCICLCKAVGMGLNEGTKNGDFLEFDVFGWI